MKRRERGAIFVVAVIVLAGLVVAVAGAANLQRVTLRAQVNRSEERLARVYAEAGIQRALAAIQTETISPGVTSLFDEWAEVGGRGAEQVGIGDASFRLEIVDAAAFVNINTVEREQLERLPLTPEQIDALLDWREPDMVPRPQGAKDDFYNSLERGYNAKLRPFDTVDELLLVRGFTPRTLYDPPDEFTSTFTLLPGPADTLPALAELVCTVSQSAPISPTGQAKLNVNVATQQAMVARGIRQQVAQAIVQVRNTQGTFTRIGDVLRVPGVTNQDAGPILDNLTTAAAQVQRGLINVNTAGEAVLNSIPEFTYDISGSIVATQTAGGFNSLGDLLTVPGVSLQLLQDTAHLFTLNSRAFIVRSLGTYGRRSVALEAKVLIVDDVARVVNLTRINRTDQWARWGWPEETTVSVVLVD